MADKQPRICPWCKASFTPNHGKQIFCSTNHRMAAHREGHDKTKPIKPPLPQFVLPIKEVLEGITLEQFRHYMETYPDQEAIKALCQEYTGNYIPSLKPSEEALNIPEEPKYLPPRPIINPEANMTHRMIEPPRGSKAYFLRHGHD